MFSYFIDHFNIYLIPPILSLIVGLSLAVLSLAKGKLKSDNIIFSLVCIWYSLLSPMFICHHLIDDENILLKLERITHIFYVYILPVNIFFAHRMLNRHGLCQKIIQNFSIVFSFVISLFTQSELYFVGMYKFKWGYIAKGNFVFQIFGVASFLTTVYMLILCVILIRKEKNHIIRMKIKYILFSFVMVAVLNIMNIPAMNGIDFYPFGNFMFIPLSIMGYSILRFKLLDIRSIIHITLIWGVLSSLILIPNVILFQAIRDLLKNLSDIYIMLIMITWFLVNYLYLKWMQPVINKFFNKQKYNLVLAESKFIEDISLLKDLEGLIDEVSTLISKVLRIKNVEISLRIGDSEVFIRENGEQYAIDPIIGEWFIGANHLVEINMVETNPYYQAIRSPMLALFSLNSCCYIVPLIQNNELFGFIFLGEKADLKQLSSDEIKFINNIRNATSISLANSIMYQNLSNLKDNLETIVKARTKELQTKNDQMLFELKVAKNVQQKIFPKPLPDNSNIKIATKLTPLMEVSGDFYDVMEIGRNKIAFALIDVSGHGVPSALLTSMIKTELENQLMREVDTGKVCIAINSGLTPVLADTGFYFTMFLGIIDLNTMVLEYTNCGHAMPYLFQSSGEMMLLDSDGFFIGASNDSQYGTERIKLFKNDKIVLYTDGITEARSSDGDFFGEDRLIECIKNSNDTDINDQVNIIMKAVDNYQDNNSNNTKDDMTIMIIQFGDKIVSDYNDSDKKTSEKRFKMKEAMKFFNAKEFNKGIDILTIDKEEFKDPFYLYMLSMFYTKTRQNDQALSSINQALALSPDNLEYLYQKGKILMAHGSIDSAYDVFMDIEKRDSSYKKAGLYISKLKKNL